MLKKIVAAMAVSMAFAAPMSMAAVDSDKLHQALVGDHRSMDNKARDVFRDPAETLAFFELAPNMTVVEVTPGGGWYTEILAPYLKDEGKLYAAGFDPDAGGWAGKAAKRFTDKLAAAPEVYAEVQVTVLNPPTKVDIAPAGSADRVLTFRNVHNWMKAGTDKAVFAAMFRALKSGGILGVVEHRGDAAVKQDPKSISGYVNQAYVISMAEAAGFKLIASSEINANAHDTKNHPKGVWTLPPSLKLKDKDRDKYLAMGESDRMTLKFVKP